MAEVIAVGASVITIIQITERIIGLCRFYIETEHDIPSDLRFILLEASMLETIFKHLDFLTACNSEMSSTVSTLSGDDGPIEGCRRSITELEKLFPSDYIQKKGQHRSKKQRVRASLATLAWPLKENKAKKLLDEIKGYKTTITLALTTESIQDIKVIKMKALEMQDMLTDSQRQEVYKWLQHTDPSPLHHRAQNDYEPGTGNWMLRTPDWANWLDAKQRCLWIHGIPGAGKTVLMSYLIEQTKEHCAHPQKEKVAYVYYYCYFGHNQDEATPFLRWLLNQLCRQVDLVPGSVYTMYKYGGEPSLEELLKALEDILDKFEITYVIVDAIDESNPRENLLKILRDLVTDPRLKKLQLLASSREYIDIERIMEGFSVSVSMANPFVEDDIKLLVRSTLQSDHKFKRWPQELLDEVEDAVSTGAKGMFRWAVCQIDVLGRLKSDRYVVKKALANLPKTLDETYDRIFLAIPEEERLFVYHALQWINYHNKLYDNGGIPCAVLLQAAGKSTAILTANQNDRFYDKETFWELCGCLIVITPEDSPYVLGDCHLSTSAVSFAHYTVYEYFNSTRISKNCPVYLTACKENLKDNCMEITLLEAHHVEQNELWERENSSEHKLEVGDAVIGDFNVYCVVSAFLSLCKRESEISQQDTLSTLAIDLLDPSKPNFSILYVAAWHIDASTRLFNNKEVYFNHFWTLTWNSHPTDTNAAHLLNILLFFKYNRSFLELAKKFLQRQHTYDFLQTRLNFTSTDLIISADDPRSEYIFDGSIIEVFAHLNINNKIFLLLLEYGTRLFDPSKVLFICTGFHDHTECIESCAVDRLLELGADPNVIKHQVTPLQIAAVNWDFEAVSMLLKAGADPNDTGNTDEIVWGEGTPMNSWFSHLHNASPLRICRHFDCSNVTHRIEEDREKVEEILLQYGAKELSSQPGSPSTQATSCSSPNEPTVSSSSSSS